jgi:hypothetical protein
MPIPNACFLLQHVGLLLFKRLGFDLTRSIYIEFERGALLPSA